MRAPGASGDATRVGAERRWGSRKGAELLGSRPREAASALPVLPRCGGGDALRRWIPAAGSRDRQVGRCQAAGGTGGL